MAKKAKRIDKPKPVRMPEKAKEQWEIIKEEEADLLRRLTELNARANLFLRGMRLAYDVPDDWDFDQGTLEFVPPKKEKDDG